jgi:excisionase family DNA binding protein
VNRSEPLAYSVSKTAEVLGCSDNTVRRMIANGELRSVRLCGRVVVPVVAIEELLGIQREPPSANELVKAFAALVGASSDDE